MTGPAEFGSYIVHEQLGVGGMASVHVAESRNVRKRVALKRLLPHAAANPELVESFIHEARLAAYLHHPNIARTFDFGQVGDIYFMAMEFVPGPTLTQLVRQCAATVGGIPLPVSLHMLCQVCEALDYAHNLRDEHDKPLGLIHRDISPPNIIISNTGLVKLIDFGIAKATISNVQTQVGTVKGKFGYIAPEYLEGMLDKRVDLWALGVVAHELLTMRRLFAGEDDLDVLKSVREMPIPPPSAHARDIPPDLDAVVMTALERDPERRWQSAAAMRNALRGTIRELGIEVTDRRVLEWIEWAFTQRPGPEHNELSQLIATLEQPSRPALTSSTPSAVRKRPKLPTPVVGAAMVRRRKRGRVLLWTLVMLLVASGAGATWWWGLWTL